MSFKSGDRVKSKTKDCTDTGVITKVITPDKLLGICQSSYSKICLTKYYDRYFPGWKDKLIYYVLLDVPSTTMSRQEVRDSLPEWWNATDLEVDSIYGEQDEVYLLLFPEDDLELTK